MRLQRSQSRELEERFGEGGVAALRDELWYLWTFLAIVGACLVDATAPQGTSFMNIVVQRIFNSSGQLREPERYASREAFLRAHGGRYRAYS